MMLRCYVLVALAITAPCATVGQSDDETHGVSISPVLEKTLSALPSNESLAEDGPWKRFIDPSMLVLRLERTHSIAKERVAELLRDFSDYSFKDVDDWYGAVEEPSVPISGEQISGRWRCRAMHVNASGALSFPFDTCNIRQTDVCLEFDKMSGPTQMSGCLHRVDDTNFVFAQTAKFDRDNERLDGFLSGSGESHLRLIVTHRYSMDIFELVKP